MTGISQTVNKAAGFQIPFSDNDTTLPVDIAQGLADAEAQDLKQIEVTPMGDGLHWETLDTDFTIAGLLAGRFGTKKWMAKLQQEWLQTA